MLSITLGMCDCVEHARTASALIMWVVGGDVAAGSFTRIVLPY